MNGYYPVMLQLRGEKCLVVGGGRIAERKVLGLLEAGADRIVLISPILTGRLQELAAAGTITVLVREYREEDVQEARLVFASTDHSELNLKIAENGRNAGAWVNVAHDADSGSFVNPSVIRRGDLIVAVTASGASPALSARLKQELEQQYGIEYAESTVRLRKLREYLKASGASPQEREALLRLAAVEAPLYQEEDADLESWIKRLRILMTGGLHNG